MERNIRSFTLVLWLAFVASLTMGLYQLSEGYFPRPVALSGFASHDEQRDIIWHKIHHEIMESTQSSMEKETLEKKVGKVVLIIIDALRYDFAAGSTSAMSFLKSLIRDSRGCAFPAFAHPPTVTLPRLKALTSGSVPNFLDVILNFASVFYGDDTWLKIFPQAFARFEGVTSFFAADTVEVDLNVTRNLENEIRRGNFGPDGSDPWDMMILHYLGLDHIGHSVGPSSSLMRPKQREMDEIIERIWTLLSRKASKNEGESLLAVVGDHGMTNSGGHGGSTYDETRPFLFLGFPNREVEGDIGINCTRGSLFGEVQQIDFAPTLSRFLGIPYPRNSLGVLIPGLNLDYPTQDSIRGSLNELQALHSNALQLLKLLESALSLCSVDCEEIHQLFTLYENAKSSASELIEQTQIDQNDLALVTDSYLKFLYSARSYLSRNASKYDDLLLWSGLLFITLSSICMISLTIIAINAVPVALRISDIILGCILSISISWLLSYFALSAVSMSTRLIFSGANAFLFTMAISFGRTLTLHTLSFISKLNQSKSPWKILSRKTLTLLMIAMAGAHSLSFFSSSFVEEEHQTFYFFVVSSILLAFLSLPKTIPLNLIKSEALKSVTFLLIFRIMRSWNRAGVKWIDLPDVSDIIFSDTMRVLPEIVTMLTIFIMISVEVRFENPTLSPYLKLSKAILLVIAPFVHHPSAPKVLAQCIFIISLTIITFAFVSKLFKGESSASYFRFGLLICAIMVNRYRNLFLLALSHLLSSLFYVNRARSFSLLFPSLVQKAIFLYWSMFAVYFTFGNSNSVATLEFGGVYNVLNGDASVIAMGLLSLITFTAAPFSLLSAFFGYHSHGNANFSQWTDKWSLISIIIAIRLGLLTTACLGLVHFRFHLFVWSVFAPKFLYEVIFTIFITICVSIAFIV